MGLPTDTWLWQMPPHSPGHVEWGTEEDVLAADNPDPARRKDRAEQHTPKDPSPIYYGNHGSYSKGRGKPVCVREIPFLETNNGRRLPLPLLSNLSPTPYTLSLQTSLPAAPLHPGFCSQGFS